MTPASTPSRSWRPWNGLAVGCVLGVLVLMTASVHGEAPPPWVPWTAALTLAGLAVLFALLAAADRRRYDEALRAGGAREAVQQDRLAIAADLHDLVSHGLGAITVRARAGQRLAASDPAAAVAALGDVTELSREATTELRRLLAVLRDPMASAPLMPAPSLRDLPDLVADARSRGLRVTLRSIEGATAAPGAQLTAFHVVKEALDNAARHAGPTGVDVEIDRRHDALVVRVTDEGPVAGWTAEPGAGHGLSMLAERIGVHGGTLHTGADGKGFRVEALIPDDAGAAE